MNLTIKRSIIIAFAIILIILAFISAFVAVQGLQTTGKLNEVDKIILPQTMSFLRLEKDVIQIQQWLTDISATRAAPGYDDGFSEAEDYYNDAADILSHLIEADQMEPETAEKLTALQATLEEFYIYGKRMADAYIEYGPDGGNPMMEVFDPYAAAMNEKLTELVDEHLSELDESMEALETTQKVTRNNSIIAAAAGLLIGIIISITIVRRLTGGFRIITEYSVDLSSGILNNRRIYKKKDEFGRLITEFNSSFDSLSLLIQTMENLAGKNTDLNNHLAESTEEVSSSVSEMGANIGQMEKQVEQQDEVVESTVTAVNQIAANIDSLTKQIENQSSAVTESSASVEEMTASINNVARLSNERNEQTALLLEQIEIASSNMKSTDSVIKEISELSSGMLKITEVINSISAQTNLLAMNAAIEAAHAGDAGKGFAVVASEIRKLAADTGTNAHLINDTLSKITAIVQTAAESSSDNRKSFEAVRNMVSGYTGTFQEINTSMEELSSGTTEIIGAVTSLSDITSQIQSASNEINMGTENVNNSISSLNELSRSVLGGIKEVNIGIKEINKAMIDLSNIAEESKESTGIVQDKLKQFTL